MEAHLYGPAKVRLDLCRASLRDMEMLGERGSWGGEQCSQKHLDNNTGVTRASGHSKKEERRERQKRWEEAEAGALWHPMFRSPLGLHTGVIHSNSVGGQIFHNTVTESAASSASRNGSAYMDTSGC